MGNFNPFETKASVVNEGEAQPVVATWKKPKSITPTTRKQDKLHPVSSSPQSQEIADVAVAAETSVATVSCCEKTRENAVGSTEEPLLQPTTIKDKLELEQKLDVSSSLNKHDIATVVESGMETMTLKQDSPSQITSTSSKPTAIVKPQSEMKVEETTNEEENKSDLVT